MGRQFKSRSRKIARESYWQRHERDTYECPDCGRTEDEINGQFEVHHKNGEPMDNRPENQIAVCRLCHNLREDKKPSLNDIRSLRGGIYQDTEYEGENNEVRVLSQLSEYEGSYGGIICPGCGEKLGVAQSAADIYWTHKCCGVDNREVQTTVVIDNDKKDKLPRAEKADQQIDPTILKYWMVEQWVETVFEKTAVPMESYKQVGWEDGEPVLIEKEEEVDISGLYLLKIESIASTWGWDVVAHDAAEAADCPEPAKGFKRAMEAAGLLDICWPWEDTSMTSLGEFVGPANKDKSAQ